MNNKNTISDKLKKVKAQYSYVEIAKRFETTDEYVYPSSCTMAENEMRYKFPTPPKWETIPKIFFTFGFADYIV